MDSSNALAYSIRTHLSCSPALHELFKGNEQRSTLSRFEVTRAMTATSDVFHKEDISSAKRSSAPVRHFNFDCSIEQYDELPLWGNMPVVVIARVVLSEDGGLRWNRVR